MCLCILQTGLSGNLIILTVFYNGGLMMNEATITVGQLSSFLLYAAFVGVSIGGMSYTTYAVPCNLRPPIRHKQCGLKLMVVLKWRYVHTGI